MRRVLLILGPTASGKSALALELSRRCGAVIVNADSMQVYRDLRVLTARPDPQEEALADHRLYGVIDGAERFSTGRWLSVALAEIKAAQIDGRPVIVAGGTGLYFAALTKGFAVAPATPPEIGARLQAECKAGGAPALHARLAGLDPAGAARLSEMDAPRIIRALAVIEATGAPLSVHQASQGEAVLPLGAWVGVTIWPERAALYGAIEQRFAAMIEGGALDEVAQLAALGLDPTLPIMKAHGAPHLMAHLAGALSLKEAQALSVRDTRRYAKRQFTWMAGQAADWVRLTMADADERVQAAMRLWTGLD